MKVEEVVKTYFDGGDHITSLTIELTNVCNLKCCHCYLGNREKAFDVQQVDYQSIKNTISQARKMNIFSITFTGGEPFTYPFFYELVEYANKLGLAVTVKTNGTFITEDNIEFIKKYIHVVVLSRYAFSSDIYYKVTGMNLYNKYVDAIDLLRQYGVRYQERGIVLKENECQIDEFIQSGIKLEGYISIEKDEPYAFEHLPSKEVTKKIYSTLLNSGVKLPTYELDKRVCNLGTCSLLINSKGEYNPCTNFYYPIGRISENSLKEVWESTQKLDLIERCKLKYFIRCSNCPNKQYIFSMAPCNNFAETGNMNTVSKNMCNHCDIIKEIVYEKNKC